MNESRSGALARGLAHLPHLPEEVPARASEHLRALLDEVRQVLRVPFVPFLFRALADDPDYLERAWRGLVPFLRTRAFERCADAIRTEALLGGFDRDRRLGWNRLGDLRRIRAFTDSTHDVLPRLLLITTALSGPELAGSSMPHIDQAEVPLGVADGTERVERVEPERVEARLEALFADIQRVHGYPRVATYFRALGQWPDFLEEAWGRLRPAVPSPPFVERRRRLTTQARALMQGMPFSPVPLEESGLDVEALLAVFRERLTPDLLLEVTALKALLDGARVACASRFSTVPGPPGALDEDWPTELHPLHGLPLLG